MNQQGIDISVSEKKTSKNWQQTMRAWCHPRVLTMLFFGFSAGVPILLIFSSLSLWLREAGVSRSAVTFFSWAALGYSFKFVWAPLVDTLPLPILTKKLGRRRSWLLLAQAAVIAAICIMALTDPAGGKQSIFNILILAL
ncbi:MAG: MFS transporter, partial [Candidatus Electrothrix sp. AR4]|nr:MFS transporter [Candidatus Electrothrix sp. AR4]